MKIEAKDGPAINQPQQAKAVDSRAKAIAAFMNKPQSPVQNPSQVSPEELSVVTPPSNGQPHTVETATTESTKPAEVTKAEPPKVDDSKSAQYALLARQERAFRAKVQQHQADLKAKEDALAAREAALSAKDTDYQTKYIQKDRLSQDPLSVLTEAGVSYDQLTNLILNSPKPENVEQLRTLNELKAELKSLKDTQAAADKAAQENQTQAYNEALSQIRRDATNLVNNNPDYETIKETKQVGEIVKLIEKTWKTERYVMDIEEAAQLVEAELVERIMATANIPKIRNKLSPPQAAPTPKLQDPKQQSQPNTLTNSISSTRPLSARERAILAAEGKLNR